MTKITFDLVADMFYSQVDLYSNKTAYSFIATV